MTLVGKNGMECNCNTFCFSSFKYLTKLALAFFYGIFNVWENIIEYTKNISLKIILKIFYKKMINLLILLTIFYNFYESNIKIFLL